MRPYWFCREFGAPSVPINGLDLRLTDSSYHIVRYSTPATMTIMLALPGHLALLMKNPPQRKPLLQFSLRAMLIVMMLVAAYATGWMSHREWNRRHLIQEISNAIEAANAPIQIETLEGSDVFMTRGRKEDVDAVMNVIEKTNK